MAYVSAHQVSENLLQILARPFVAFGNWLITLAGSSSVAQKTNRLADMTDEDLAAQGLTREQAIAKIFAAHAHL